MFVRGGLKCETGYFLNQIHLITVDITTGTDTKSLEHGVNRKRKASLFLPALKTGRPAIALPPARHGALCSRSFCSWSASRLAGKQQHSDPQRCTVTVEAVIWDTAARTGNHHVACADEGLALFPLCLPLTVRRTYRCEPQKVMSNNQPCGFICYGFGMHM